MRKVKVNKFYRFNPVLLDIVDPPVNIAKGATVRVVNFHGCPKANTMGHCYVQNLDGSFGGLVCCNSLEPVR